MVGFVGVPIPGAAVESEPMGAGQPPKDMELALDPSSVEAPGVAMLVGLLRNRLPWEVVRLGYVIGGH